MERAPQLCHPLQVLSRAGEDLRGKTKADLADSTLYRRRWEGQGPHVSLRVLSKTTAGGETSEGFPQVRTVSLLWGCLPPADLPPSLTLDLQRLTLLSFPKVLEGGLSVCISF